MKPADLKNAFKIGWIDKLSIGTLLNSTSRYILEHGTDEVSLDAVVRLCERRADAVSAFPAAGEIIDSLCREVGLFTYAVDVSGLAWRERAVIEVCRAKSNPDFVLHRDQKSAFERLKDGENLIVSAPTSFGKTALIDLLIDELRPKVVVYVVPTIALMDERRRRFTLQFGEDYQVITQPSQERLNEKPVIYVQTQERLLDRDDLESVDLFVVDEFYKLDPDRMDERHLALNAALYKFLRVSRQVVMLGPFVSTVKLSKRYEKRFHFFESHTSTVAIDVIDYSESKDPATDLAEIVKDRSGDSTLVYSRSPASARKIAMSLISSGIEGKSKELSDFSDWLAESYHPYWYLVRALRSGIGLHHGQIPRSVGQALVTLFNNGVLQTLICTSTLIEGVNTVAKNVVVFDKKIDRRNLDFFSFKNIAGRSGRMGFHYVGRVFLFHEPPEPELFSVTIPILGSSSELRDELLVGVDDSDLDVATKSRKKSVLNHTDIPPELFKLHARLGISGLKSTYDKIAEALLAGATQLSWKNPFPTYNELETTLTMGWSELEFNRGRLRSARQATFFAMRLGIAGGNIRKFLDVLVSDKSEEDAAKEIDIAFSAMRALEFSIPTLLAATQDLANVALQKLKREPVSYANYIFAVQNLFVDPTLKGLDEYGLPIPFSQQLFTAREMPVELDAAVDAVRRMRDSTLPLRGVDNRAMLILKNFV